MIKINDDRFLVMSDEHFGARNDSAAFLKKQLDYYENEFFPYIIKNNIRIVLSLGDLFHSRKSINPRTIHWVRKRFIKKFKEHDINLYLLLGNHDNFYQTDNSISSIKELFEDTENVYIIDKNEIVEFDNKKIGMVPFLSNKEKKKEFLDFINNNKFDILCGHFDIKDFDVMPGYKADGEDCLNKDIFDRIDLVLSGHYHCTQRKGNILYVGTPYELTWTDHDYKKGFWVYENNDIKMVENNNYKFFQKLFYDDSDDDKFKKLLNEAKNVTDKFVKLIIVNKTKHSKYVNVIDLIEKNSPYQYNIINIIEDNFNDSDDSENVKFSNPIEIIEKYLNDTENKNKDKLISIYNMLYKQILMNDEEDDD
jgi:DNA repair exonuclease SbcCD nuclease subunit